MNQLRLFINQIKNLKTKSLPNKPIVSSLLFMGIKILLFHFEHDKS